MGRLLSIILTLCILISVMNTFSSSAVNAVEDRKLSLSYLYFGDTGGYSGLVSATNGSLNVISPSYFDLDSDGSLKLSVSVDKAFIDEMHDKGIKVIPFLSNHWDRKAGIKALGNSEYLAVQIVDAIQKYGLDGVNVDIENLTSNECASYTDFVRILKGKLPAGKSLTVAVAPKPYTKETEWQKSYDYKELASYADYLVLMSYDQSYQGGKAGPVASASFVESSIKNVLKAVPSSKLVLGLPFYGRYWKQGASYGGYGISAYKVDELIKKYRGAVTYSSSYKSPKAVITIKSGDEKPYVHGVKLGAGKYDIWYENEQSLKYKLTLVKKYNLRGSGSWSLGQESDITWNYYKLWLSGYYFNDVDCTWAVDSIINMAKRGWMVGISGMKFMPDASLTRAQAVAILVRAMGLINSDEYTNRSSVFSDIGGHWAAKEIAIAKDSNIVQGIGNGRFGPDLPVTREQIAIMLARLPVQYYATSAQMVEFNDVNAKANALSFLSICKIAEAGVICGFPDGSFRPFDFITRAQMAVVMNKASIYIDNGNF